MTHEADITIIGAGVVGLAIAAQVARPGRAVYILEKNARYGLEQSSRNSQTIHAGILCEAPLKTALCIEGHRRIFEMSERYGIGTIRCGKLCIATTDAEIEMLEASYQRAINRGVSLKMLSQAEIKRLEPNLVTRAACHSPNTGIVDVLGLMSYFVTKAQSKGAILACGTEVTGVEKLSGGYRVIVQDASGQSSITTNVLVNSAGLHSDRIAEMVGIDIDAAGYRENWVKGEFYSVLNGKNRLIKTLIYPIPLPSSIDIHVCLDTDWRLRLGPHCYPTSEINYAVDDSRREVFLRSSIMQALPFIEPDDLEPEGSGILIKLAADTDKKGDFFIRHEAERGLPGLINLVGMGSPAMTASPAIGRYVAEMVGKII